MKKLISLMVILPLLTTTINNPHAAAAETDSTSYRRGPSLCARLAMAGASILAIASGAYADDVRVLGETPTEGVKKQAISAGYMTYRSFKHMQHSIKDGEQPVTYPENAIKYSKSRLFSPLLNGEENGQVVTQYEIGLDDKIGMKASIVGKKIKRLGRNLVWEEEYKEKEKQWVRAKFPGAFKGDAKSQCLLGLMYRQGTEIDQDYDQALYWLEKSASQRNIRAIRNLATMYFKGEGVKKDFSKSRNLYQQAGDLGDEESKENLKVFRYE